MYVYCYTGRDLLIKPVVTQGQATLDVYLPGQDEVHKQEVLNRFQLMQSFINNGVFLSSQLWYDLSSKKFHLGGQTIHVATPLNMVNLKLFLVIRRAI
jgi:alpha-glucosidase (family GH31 glycosyl hydrolase)